MILPANVLKAWFEKQTYLLATDSTSTAEMTFWFTFRKLITTIELQYYVNLKGNFNLNKFENLSIQFEKQSIISIQSFFSVMGVKTTK